MKNYTPWKRNPEGDPDYIWYSYVNEAGMMVYATPQECPNDIPKDTTEGAMQFRCMKLKLFGTKEMRVFWTETTNRELAFDQKRWLEAEAQRIERANKRTCQLTEEIALNNDGNRKKTWSLLDENEAEYTPESDTADETSENCIESQPGDDPDAINWDIDDDVVKDENTDTGNWYIDNEGKEEKAGKPKKGKRNRKDEKDFRPPYMFPQTEHHAFVLIELEAVRKYIEERQPRWWQALYLKKMWGASAEEIADELGINPSRVYQIIDAAEKLAREFREKAEGDEANE